MFGNVAHVITMIVPSIGLFKKDYVEVLIHISIILKRDLAQQIESM
jgi:hypothetical protein